MITKKRTYEKSAVGLTPDQYANKAAAGINSALRCWKSEHWAYNLLIGGERIWAVLKRGENVSYKTNSYEIDCVFNSHIRITSELPAHWVDGVWGDPIQETPVDVLSVLEGETISRVYEKDVTGMNKELYVGCVSKGFWNALRCWKSEHWAYNLKNEEGLIWKQIREGRDVLYEGRDFKIDCKFGQYVKIVSNFDKSQKDGEYFDVSGLSVQGEKGWATIYYEGRQLGGFEFGYTSTFEQEFVQFAKEMNTHPTKLRVLKTLEE